ncbi:MAG TPA: hypothetical protein VFN55_15810 [Solirubrobacteraceae bacterium]|nr:hypothetical protein [Solirubrobacteraceae bacterium]
MGADRLGIGALLGQARTGARVQAGAFTGAQVLLDGRAYERVHEGQRSLGRDQFRRREHVGGRPDTLSVDLGQRGHAVQRRPVAEHGQDAGDPDGIRVQPGQPSADRPGDRRRHARRQPPRVRRSLAQGQRGDQLTDRERVAARRLGARGHQARLRRAADPFLQQRRDRREAEWGQ